MHIDHGSLLGLSFDELISKVLVHDVATNYRAIYANRHSEASALAQHRCQAAAIGSVFVGSMLTRSKKSGLSLRERAQDEIIQV